MNGFILTVIILFVFIVIYLFRLVVVYKQKLSDNSKTIEEFEVFKDKYKDIIDLDDEKANTHEEISKLIEQKNIVQNDNRVAFEQMNNEYLNAKNIYEQLKVELLSLEEDLEITSFGLYKPHFDYDTSELYKLDIEKVVMEAKELIQNNNAVICETDWLVNDSVVQGRKMTRHYSKIMLRAFNGECDAAILKVKWNNILNMEERLNKSFIAINKLGESHNIRITEDYLENRLKELRLAYEYQEKIHDEKEEQRRIREQMREEERSIKEIEKAREEAEKEEARYQKSLIKAREELLHVHGAEFDKLKDRIVFLEESLRKAQELKARAISMAQITKAGHVYVISNIGSFGEDVYKIGMTRRMEPSDRVRELSGASVPFAFDIHAIIFSENAPELETKLHKKFSYNRVNLINNRKEFFKVNLAEIENFAKENDCKIEFTKLAEAKDFRQTCLIRCSKTKEEIENELFKEFPANLYNIEEYE